MKKSILLFLLSCTLVLDAKEEEYHEHEGFGNVKLNYETLDFTHSKKKIEGVRFGIELDYQESKNHYQIYVENTKTDTTKIVPRDLDVYKYTLKYQHKIAPNKIVSLLYIKIDDNLMKETDKGNIYGLGYQYLKVGLSQYISDYPHFDVYQSDLKYSIKKRGIKWTFLGKYIHLHNKNSNNFSKKAKDDYFTAGLKIHTHYKGYHLGVAVFAGKRVFAVMKEGFKVQHHAMEFKESYMCGVGHKLSKNLVAHLRYSYHKAKEIPIDNDNVKVKNLAFDMVYKF